LLDSIVKDFAHLLKKELKDNLKNFFLFGSRARGDFHEGSDYDFLIVLAYKDSLIVEQIRKLEVKLLSQFDVLLASIIYDENEWKKRENMPIAINIRKEGISI